MGTLPTQCLPPNYVHIKYPEFRVRPRFPEELVATTTHLKSGLDTNWTATATGQHLTTHRSGNQAAAEIGLQSTSLANCTHAHVR